MTSDQPSRRTEGAWRALPLLRPIGARADAAEWQQKVLAISRSKSRRPDSIQRRSTTCIRASSLRTSSTACTATTTWRDRSRSNQTRPTACPRCQTTFARGRFESSAESYFQDDPAFKGEQARIDRRRLRVLVEAISSIRAGSRRLSPTLARAEDPRHGCAARSGAERQAAVRLRHAGRRHACARSIHAAVQICRAASRVSFKSWPTADLYGAVAREVVEAYGDTIPAHPVGTGPFRLAEWRRSSRIVLERNPTYREVLYDADPMPTTPKARRCCRSSKAASCR